MEGIFADFKKKKKNKLEIYKKYWTWDKKKKKKILE